MEMTPVFRFAPSPNGRLHLGHAFSALLNAALAEQYNGRFLLRIEDIDTARCTPDLAQAIRDDLSWLGLAWQQPVRVQSQHWQDYRDAVQALKGQGLLYPCFCSRREVAVNALGCDPDGAPLYPGTCLALSPSDAEDRIESGMPHSWRLRMDAALSRQSVPVSYQRFHLPSLTHETVAANPARWGDAILVRKETPTSYHVSVVVDDAIQQVSHVVRGADLEAATDLHALIQRLLGLASPLYHHHALVLAPQGDKLSKSRQSETLADLRARGITPGQVRDFFAANAAHLLG